MRVPTILKGPSARSELARRDQQKRKAPGDMPGAFYDLRLRLTASPSAASRQPHLLVTTTHWDHLLPLKPPRSPPGTSRRQQALAPRATLARSDETIISNRAGPNQGVRANSARRGRRRAVPVPIPKAIP